MEKVKFIILSIIVLSIVALLSYWAVLTIEPGDAHVERQKQKALEERNAELEKEVAELKSDLGLLLSEQEKQTPSTPTNELEGPPIETTATSSKYQSLINELQKLITDKVVMKEKSRGTRVGTIQNFLNIYNNTSKRVDNDYGKTTKADVAAFQKAVGLTADGEAGTTTFQKMIDWLKAH